jgi:8-oxo-dGTP pyrophosphatase MutT (NUDIX family)
VDRDRVIGGNRNPSDSDPRDSDPDNFFRLALAQGDVPVPTDAQPVTEEAFGIVPIYLPQSGDRAEALFLLVQHRAGHWAFPKGHAEPGESALETALREFTEETGIQHCTPVTDVQFVETYCRQNKLVQKTVTYFPAWVLDRETNLQPEEIQDSAWLTAEEARSRITFPANRGVLESALEWLQALPTMPNQAEN